MPPLSRVPPLELNRTKLGVPAVQVRPSGGDLKLHCRCGADDFIACKVHVAAEGNQARITNLICPQCAKIWNVDPQGAWIEGEGQRN